MKTTIILFAAFGLLYAEDKYTTKYDSIDIDEVIKSERLIDAYVGCLLGNKPCAPDGAELKKNLPEALENDCAGCSEAQKNAANKFSHHLIDKRPEDWKLLEAIYDPEGSYRIKYLDNKNKIELIA